jgi:perosamine synthetase
MAVILITGGSGLLGVNWAIHRRNVDDVHLVLHSRGVAINCVKNHHVDLSDLDATNDLLKELNPDIVIHTAGLTDVDECEINPKKSEIANYLIARSVARACANRACKLVHISTDHLFDGNSPKATEETVPNPQNVYATHKLAAEEAVLEVCPAALVVRTNFLGWGPSYRRSFSDKIIDTLEADNQIQSFDDVFFSPISITRLIDLVHEVLERDCFGRLHIGSGERISKYDFTVKLAKAFGFNGDYIQPVQAGRFRNSVKRPSDLSLSSKLLEGILDIVPITIDGVINDLLNDQQSRREVQRVGKVIPYGKHFIDNNDIEAVVKTLRSGWLTQGPAIPAFEQKIAEFVGARFAVAVSSATAGLHIAYKALGARPSRSVITSPITFVSTANAAVFCGATVRFSDVNPTTINLDAKRLDEQLKLHEDIEIVAPVLFGGAADGIPEVCKTAQKYGKKIVEDAAHALGAHYSNGARVGSCAYSDCTVFSLHPVKSIAAGEGGVVTTNDEDTYRSLLRLRSHGINKYDDPYLVTENAYTDGVLNPWYYEMQDVGYHYRITDIQASLALSQMSKLDLFLESRKNIVRKYRDWSTDLPYLEHAQSISVDASANHLFVAKIDFSSMRQTRNSLMRELKKRNIVTQVHYIPVVMQPYYSRSKVSLEDLPVAKSYYEHALSLPLYHGLTEDDFTFVCQTIEALAISG